MALYSTETGALQKRVGFVVLEVQSIILPQITQLEARGGGGGGGETGIQTQVTWLQPSILVTLHHQSSVKTHTEGLRS